MIEPQNSMIPLAAEPQSADSPRGDSIGFGEMLAQSLGLVTAADPTVVQQIETREHQQNADGNSEEGRAESPPPRRGPTTSVSSVTGNAAEQTAAPAPKNPVVPIDGIEAGAEAAEARRLVRADAKRTPVMPGTGPVRTIPAPPTPVATPAQAGPVDNIWTPRLDTVPETGASFLVAEPDVANPAPAQAPGLPVVGPESRPTPPSGSLTPGTPQPVPVVGLEPITRPPVDEEPPYPIAPTIPSPPSSSELTRGPRLVVAPPDGAAPPVRIARPSTGRRVPTPPSPAGDLAPAPQGPHTSAEVPQVVLPESPHRVDLAHEVPVHVGDSQQVATSPIAGSTSEPAFPVFTEASAPVDGQPTFHVLSGETQASSTAPASSGDINPVQSSALAERVMQAVDLQRTQPPPRSMVVDIPEIEGLRLVVSVRSGGQVSVTPAIGSTNPDAFAPFTDDLSRVLTDRGFVMTGDGRRRGHNPYTADEQQPESRRRQSFRHAAPTDNDLRI